MSKAGLARTTVSSTSSTSSSHNEYNNNNSSDCDCDSEKKKEITMMKKILNQWKGRQEFLSAQAQVVGVLAIAWIGNNWPNSYPRNNNHNMPMFWFMNAAILVAALATMKHDANGSARGVQLLSRSQTEEWKGWMQWAFIMYHYYRAYSVYNEIRVFVSAYVWMTGFGNFLYFDKKQDFSLERAISMWIRINYFPLLLSFFIGVPLDLFYIVPLHTTGFFITMATCYVAKLLEPFSKDAQYRNVAAVALCLIAHVVFYETPLVNFLKLFSEEIFFRFQADKYSAALGIASGLCWSKLKAFMNWCHNNETPTDMQRYGAWGQRFGGAFLIFLWYSLFGYITDKYTYNPLHPFIFWMPVFGWLMLRNSSKYLTEVHSTVLEFFGKITLETYVLQFHLFMCQNVQHIPVVIPGSGEDGSGLLKFLNMLLCGVIFVAVAYWARKITVTTQTTATELAVLFIKGVSTPANSPSAADRKVLEGADQEKEEETVSLTKDSEHGQVNNV